MYRINGVEALIDRECDAPAGAVNDNAYIVRLPFMAMSLSPAHQLLSDSFKGVQRVQYAGGARKHPVDGYNPREEFLVLAPQSNERMSCIEEKSNTTASVTNTFCIESITLCKQGMLHEGSPSYSHSASLLGYFARRPCNDGCCF